jgi:hypothetical protein
VSLDRAEVATISSSGPKPLRVEIKNERSDDAVDVELDGGRVTHGASEGGEWIDITGKLKDGNHDLRLRIRNDRGEWAYRPSLRISGRVIPLECGAPRVAGRVRTRRGKTGWETGVIDDLPTAWLFVDGASGRAEVLP